MSVLRRDLGTRNVVTMAGRVAVEQYQMIQSSARLLHAVDGVRTLARAQSGHESSRCAPIHGLSQSLQIGQIGLGL